MHAGTFEWRFPVIDKPTLFVPEGVNTKEIKEMEWQRRMKHVQAGKVEWLEWSPKDVEIDVRVSPLANVPKEYWIVPLDEWMNINVYYERRHKNNDNKKSEKPMPTWDKMVGAYLYMYRYYEDVCDWYIKVDADAYLFVPYIREFLSFYNPAIPHYLGYSLGGNDFTRSLNLVYHCGGYLFLSKGALERLVIPLVNLTYDSTAFPVREYSQHVWRERCPMHINPPVLLDPSKPFPHSLSRYLLGLHPLKVERYKLQGLQTLYDHAHALLMQGFDPSTFDKLTFFFFLLLSFFFFVFKDLHKTIDWRRSADFIKIYNFCLFENMTKKKINIHFVFYKANWKCVNKLNKKLALEAFKNQTTHLKGFDLNVASLYSQNSFDKPEKAVKQKEKRFATSLTEFSNRRIHFFANPFFLSKKRLKNLRKNDICKNAEKVVFIWPKK
ncbi:hypothetical protein RFI_22215 [Reticulomyxa filosa]|uniref:Uncharacterized protein n=1 Tax=Reticulomyxa filosa TaxID=46433 RepID=X6MNY6_RETFI|nr:hypothetical protein RFI_22215 [Reticulomyxa filosa]|eukprot:ETO15152.1 hypothetical protein RFI_22215 [Reticulomyxa filosa]